MIIVQLIPRSVVEQLQCHQQILTIQFGCMTDMTNNVIEHAHTHAHHTHYNNILKCSRINPK